jgi:hypothetical protein
VRKQRRPWRGEEPGVDRRLAVEHVESGSIDASVFECIDECIFVDHRTAGGIHEDGRVLHQSQLGGTDEVARRIV